MPDKIPASVGTLGDILDGLPPAGVGHNNPPEPTPYEAVKQEIEDLYLEAGNWLDGEPIANEAQAAEIAELKRRIQAAAKKAEAQRVAEKKPHDDAAAAVQALYNPLIQKGKGKTELAIAAANKALAPWLAELDRQQREIAAEAQRKAQEAAEAARAASLKAAESASLAEREEADRLQDFAKAVNKTARAAETAKPQVHATGGGRAIGMKTVYHPELSDPAAAIEYFRKMRPAALKEWMLGEARDIIRVGPKPPGSIPGFTIKEEKVPV